MAFQNVSTPRFYVNVLEWLFTTEAIGFFRDIYRTLPVNQEHGSLIFGGNNYDAGNISTLGLLDNKSFMAILGHDISPPNGFHVAGPSGDLQPLVNFDNYTPPYKGFSMATFDGTGTETIEFWVGDTDPVNKVGSVVIGTYYDMAHSPNLSLSVGCDYGKPKETITHNGSSISNTMWTKPPMWGGKPPWELYEGSMWESPRRSGRRTWDMKFSFLSSSSVFSEVSSINAFESLSPEGDFYADPLGNTLLDDQTSFFSQVWHKTLGGTLPFIFQPDKDNNNPDQFAICMFKNSSLKIVQSAFQVYDISLSIEEVW